MQTLTHIRWDTVSFIIFVILELPPSVPMCTHDTHTHTHMFERVILDFQLFLVCFYYRTQSRDAQRL